MEKIAIKYDAEFAGRLYGSYLKSNRVRLGITPKQISKGLCSTSELSEIENGKKNAGWLCRERLLLRAGVARDAYESYLNCEDHAEWEIQKEIIAALEKGDAAEMTVWLEKYAEAYKLEKWKWDGNEKLRGEKSEKRKGREGGILDNETETDVNERLRCQFYLGMTGMCRKLSAAPMEELAVIFKKAVQMTIPTMEEGSMYGLALCPEEIHLILEYAQCLPFYEALRCCRELQKYLQSTRMDDWERVLNHPKVLLVLCQILSEQKDVGIKTYEEIKELCDQGIDLLRKTKKMYYLLELLDMKKWSVGQIEKLFYQQKEVDREGEDWEGEKEEKAALFGKVIAEIEEWQECFQELYCRFGILERKNTDAWLYHRQNVYCIGDIIRIRRKMLKMTRRELYDGICSKDTLERLEGKKKNTQPPILWDLCRRLGLSPECERTEIVTGNPRAYELERQIRHAANNGKFKENLGRIEELKSLVDMSNKINQQWVLRTEGMARYKEGEIDKGEYEEWLKRALECTLPLSVLELRDEEECYLTNAEMACIYHLARLYGEGEEKDYQGTYERMRLVFRVEREFEEKGEEENHISSYELYIKYASTLLCDFGKQEDSQQCAEKVLRVCLKMRRANILDGALYDWLRSENNLTREREPERVSYDWKKDLGYCLTLSRFCRNIVQEKFYKMLYEG